MGPVVEGAVELAGEVAEHLVVADNGQHAGIQLAKLVAHQQLAQAVMLLGGHQHNVFGLVGGDAGNGGGRRRRAQIGLKRIRVECAGYLGKHEKVVAVALHKFAVADDVEIVLEQHARTI